jgi:hypothetical protein
MGSQGCNTRLLDFIDEDLLRFRTCRYARVPKDFGRVTESGCGSEEVLGLTDTQQ